MSRDATCTNRRASRLRLRLPSVCLHFRQTCTDWSLLRFETFHFTHGPEAIDFPNQINESIGKTVETSGPVALHQYCCYIYIGPFLDSYISKIHTFSGNSTGLIEGWLSKSLVSYSESQSSSFQPFSLFIRAVCHTGQQMLVFYSRILQENRDLRGSQGCCTTGCGAIL